MDTAAEPAPPQPLSMPSSTTLTASSMSIGQRHRFFQPKQHNRTASVAPGISGRELRRRAAVIAAAFTVSVVEAAAPDGVTVCGEKLHVAPAGNPEHANETGELNPFTGVTEIAVDALCPDWTVKAAGFGATEKSGEPLVPGDVQNWMFLTYASI